MVIGASNCLTCNKTSTNCTKCDTSLGSGYKYLEIRDDE